MARAISPIPRPTIRTPLPRLCAHWARRCCPFIAWCGAVALLILLAQIQRQLAEAPVTTRSATALPDDRPADVILAAVEDENPGGQR